MSTRALLLLLLGLAALLPGLNRLVPERQQELRVVLVAQNMADGGSWLIPEFQRTPRLKKPPLAYWAAAFPATLIQDAPIWVYRVPGVLAGLGLLFGIWAVGRRLLPDDGAFAAAVLTAFCFTFLRLGRLAETDVMQAAFLTWSLWAAAKTGERPLQYWALCGLFAGLAFLTKGLAAVVVPPIAIGAVWRFRRDLVKAHTVGGALGLLLFAIVALPWTLFIWNHPSGQAAMQAETAALMGKNKHTGPFFYYVYTGLVHGFPASILGVLGLWKTRGLWSASTKALLAWFAGVFLLLSLLPSKQAHYYMLLLAPAALLAVTWEPLATWFTRRRILLAAVLLAGLGVLYAHVIYPRTNPLAGVRHFVEEARETIDEAPKVHVVGINSAIFEFHVGHIVHNIDSAKAAWDRAGKGDAVLVIGKAHKADLPKDVEPLRLERTGEYVYALFLKP